MSTTSRLNFQTAQESDTPSPQTTNVNDGRPALVVLGGISNVLGMRPPTAKEAKLEKDNHRLKEENKVLRTEYYNVQMAARKYHHDAFRFHHENQRLTETLEAMSLEIKGITKRYEEAKSLAETRLKRVLAAQVFVTSEADSQSILDLIHKVESLKDEIEISNSADSDAEAKMQDGADPLPTILTSTTSSSRSKGSHNNKPDPDTTSFASDGFNDENATTTTSETRTNAIPGADQGGDLRNSSDSEATLTKPVAQGTSDVLGGIANTLGMSPPTGKEAKLEKDNHRLKEENKVLRTEYYNVQKAARKYHHDAFRFKHENQRLTETLEAMSLEIKGVKERYEEAKSLSETRWKRLLAAQVFLTSEEAGLPSMSELIQKVDTLNGDEYLQALE